MKNTLTAIDWNGTRTEFEPGDRVLFHDDDGGLFNGTVSMCSEQLHVNFDDGDAGWESPEQCEIIKYLHYKRVNPLDYPCWHSECHPAHPCKIKTKKSK